MDIVQHAIFICPTPHKRTLAARQ